MKFEFCGAIDCPDWVLAQLFHASNWDLANFELVCLKAREAILNDGNLNEEEMFVKLGLYEDLAAMGNQPGSQLDIDDARACFGAVNFILTNASSNRVNSKQLSAELEQLGLASEQSRHLCEELDKHSEALAGALLATR